MLKKLQRKIQFEHQSVFAIFVRKPDARPRLSGGNFVKGITVNDQDIEKELQANGMTAPRITLVDIEANILSEHYFTARDGRRGAIADGSYVGREKPQQDERDLQALDLLTFCVLVLRNGFTVTGESACVSPENFDDEIGRRVARQNAINKVWPLMGYELKSSLTKR